MSWKQKIQSEFVIITGDGKQYKPIAKNFKKGVEFNISQFDFPNQSGSLIKKGRPRGTKFPLELYFQGEDHIDQATAFHESANDQRAWTILHPYYGQINGHPFGLDFDDTVLNTTLVTGTFVESISQDNPKSKVDPVDKTIADKETTDQLFAESFANDVTPSISDKNKLTSNNDVIYKEGVKSIIDKANAEEYFNLFNKANAAILNATSEPLLAITAIQSVISYPFLFEIAVKTRIETLINQFENLHESVATIATKAEKKIYENNAGAIISTMAASSATPIPRDYANRMEVLAIIELIIDNYNIYIDDLDSLQTENGGQVDSYIPDADSLIALNNLINFTLANLYIIALGTKQERSIILENDSNVILLTHRFYGLDPDDANIDTFMNQNQIGINELFQVKKGKKIIYYV